MTANATTSKPARANYRFVNTSDKLAALSLEGAKAYHGATLDKFAAHFANTDYAIVAASANVKHSDKRGDTYEIVITTSIFGVIHITVNTTAALDYRKVAKRYVDMCEKRRTKSAEAAKPENVAAKAKAKAERAAKRDATNYYNYLIKHGMREDLAKAEYERRLADNLAKAA